MNKVKIALMTNEYGSGLWLQVGDNWYCVLDAAGRPSNIKVGPQQQFAITRAKLYKDLSSIVLGEVDDSSRSS